MFAHHRPPVGEGSLTCTLDFGFLRTSCWRGSSCFIVDVCPMRNSCWERVCHVAHIVDDRHPVGEESSWSETLKQYRADSHCSQVCALRRPPSPLRPKDVRPGPNMLGVQAADVHHARGVRESLVRFGLSRSVSYVCFYFHLFLFLPPPSSSPFSAYHLSFISPSQSDLPSPPASIFHPLHPTPSPTFPLFSPSHPLWSIPPPCLSPPSTLHP